MHASNAYQPIIAQKIESSVAAEIKKGSSVISEGVNIMRLVFETPFKRTDLNIAIFSKTPDKIPLFLRDRRWTALKTKIGEEEKTVYININSLHFRFNLDKSEIYQAIKDHTLEKLVSDRLHKKMNEIEDEENIIAPAAKTPQSRVTSYIERVKGALVDSWWMFTTGSWDLLRFRFLLGASDERLQEQGQLRAIAAYHNAYKRVPAYKKHINENLQQVGGKPLIPERFEDVPPTDKKNYIQKFEDVENLYLDGKIPKKGQLDSSTGTTGEPALWMRSAEEMAVTQKLMSFAKKAKFGNENVILINTFALGLWATGVTLAGAGAKQSLTANVGIVPDYAEKTVSIIKKLCKDSTRPIVLCGYPPNIRKIGEAIRNDPILKDKQLNLHAVVGGEAMTEELREDILKNGFSKVFSSYGASDLDINIGNESDTEVTIRQACMKNPALANELYGGGPPPMVFTYDPLHYFIETNKDGELLYTCCYKERASPRIRYNLHDTGKVMMSKDVKAILKKYGVEINPLTNLPFLFIHGREGTVSYGGSKIHYEHLEQGIRAIDPKNIIGRDRFALYKPQEDKLEFWIEATSDAAYEEMRKNINGLQENLINKIAESNTDFKKILDGKANPFPQIRLFKPNKSPMAIHAQLNPHRKLQRVVVNDENLQKQLVDLADSTVTSTGNYPHK